MTRAFKCDVCNITKEGKPFGIIKMRMKGGKTDAELCANCYNMIREQIK
jgi:hypothetical protein